MRVREYTEVTEALALLKAANGIAENGVSAGVGPIDVLRIVERKLENVLRAYAPKAEHPTLVQEWNGSCHE